MRRVGQLPFVFTGIVEEAGRVLATDEEPDGRRVRIATGFDDLSPGQSIAVDGACLTVEAFDPVAEVTGGDGPTDHQATSAGTAAADVPQSAAGAFSAFLAEETIDRTTLGRRGAGDPVNLERAMPAEGRFDGHVVQGHVDGTAELLDVEPVGEDAVYTFELPEDLSRYVVEKGSITVDGISLTVADRTADRFSVAIVPTTRDVTTLSERTPGDRVNLEVDVLAKYAERLLQESNSVQPD